MIRNYLPQDDAQLLELWNTAGCAMGFAPMNRETFSRLLIHHPDFSPAHTFLLEEGGRVLGFVSGCTGDHIPRGQERGYFSCLILAREADSRENTGRLLSELEDSFRRAGKRYAAVTFFNPIRLPWVIPGTAGHQHNNAPGIPTELPLYGRMLDLGYREAARENAMYLDLAAYSPPDFLPRLEKKAAEEGYSVAAYDPSRHTGLEEMLEALNNPLWKQEIPAAAQAGQELLVGLYKNRCAGFTGPIYPEETGRGYFAGIGVATAYERHGLGTMLFHRLCQREREKGAAYMSLFTGSDNHAAKIYLGAGFRIVRSFGVMLKDLEEV